MWLARTGNLLRKQNVPCPARCLWSKTDRAELWVCGCGWYQLHGAETSIESLQLLISSPHSHFYWRPLGALQRWQVHAAGPNEPSPRSSSYLFKINFNIILSYALRTPKCATSSSFVSKMHELCPHSCIVTLHVLFISSPYWHLANSTTFCSFIQASVLFMANFYFYI
jgi:hypothetical protein